MSAEGPASRGGWLGVPTARWRLYLAATSFRTSHVGVAGEAEPLLHQDQRLLLLFTKVCQRAALSLSGFFSSSQVNLLTGHLYLLLVGPSTAVPSRLLIAPPPREVGAGSCRHTLIAPPLRELPTHTIPHTIPSSKPGYKYTHKQSLLA